MAFTEELGVRSSFISWLGYLLTYERWEIHVRMNSGWTYVYRIGEDALWANFKAALSKGKYYNLVIKRRFDYVRKYR